MKPKLVILILVLFIGSCLTASAWWKLSWAYRKAITIDNTSGGTLTDYQVLVGITNVMTSGKAQSDGSDLRVVDSDDATAIDFYYHQAKSNLWAKVPLIPTSSTKIIYLYYGNAVASSLSSFDNTFTKDYSGDSGLVGQWNMDEGSGTNLEDSSANSNDGTVKVDPNDVAWVTSDGGHWGVDSSVKFSSGACITNDPNDFVDCGNDSSVNFGTNSFTIEAWICTTDADIGDVVGKRPVQVTPEVGYAFGISANQGYCFLGDGPNGNNYYIGTPGCNDGQWHHIAGVFNRGAGQITWYGDCTAYGPTDVSSVTGSVNNAKNLGFGQGNGSTGDGHTYDGIYDEIRIYQRALSQAELRCHYERRRYTSPEPSTLLGAEEKAPKGTSFSIR